MQPKGSAPSSVLGALLVFLSLVMSVASAVTVAGCAPETRYRILSTLVDGVPPPGTPRVERRRQRLARVEPMQPPTGPVLPDPALFEEEVETFPRYETYEELVAALPKDTMGNVNWVAAVEAELIDPQPGIEDDAQALPQFPLDIRMDPGIPQMEVTFPHAAHTYWLRCDNCHPQIFEMRAGANPITMTKIFQGEYCGRCHGKVAFPPATGCPRCHRQLGSPSG